MLRPNIHWGKPLLKNILTEYMRVCLHLKIFIMLVDIERYAIKVYARNLSTDGRLGEG